MTDTFVANYALTAAAFAIGATALAHVLVLTTPTPRAFFSWIVGLMTAGAVVLPFTRGDDPAPRSARRSSTSSLARPLDRSSAPSCRGRFSTVKELGSGEPIAPLATGAAKRPVVRRPPGIKVAIGGQA